MRQISLWCGSDGRGAGRTRRRGIALAVALTAAGTGAIGLGTAPVVQANSWPSPTFVPPATVTADALPTVQINGVVWAQAVVGNTVYVGGSFTSARPAGSPLGTNEVPRANFLAYDLTTGALLTSVVFDANAQVRTIDRLARRLAHLRRRRLHDLRRRSRATASPRSTPPTTPSSATSPRASATTSTTSPSPARPSTSAATSPTSARRSASGSPRSASTGALLSWAPSAGDRAGRRDRGLARRHARSPSAVSSRLQRHQHVRPRPRDARRQHRGDAAVPGRRRHPQRWPRRRHHRARHRRRPRCTAPASRSAATPACSRASSPPTGPPARSVGSRTATATPTRAPAGRRHLHREPLALLRQRRWLRPAEHVGVQPRPAFSKAVAGTLATERLGYSELRRPAPARAAHLLPDHQRRHVHRPRRRARGASSGNDRYVVYGGEFTNVNGVTSRASSASSGASSRRTPRDRSCSTPPTRSRSSRSVAGTVTVNFQANRDPRQRVAAVPRVPPPVGQHRQRHARGTRAR